MSLTEVEDLRTQVAELQHELAKYKNATGPNARQRIDKMSSEVGDRKMQYI